MRIWYSDTFQGVYPVGSCAVVVAEDEGAARELLAAELKAHGLTLRETDLLKEIDLSKPNAAVLVDGDY